MALEIANAGALERVTVFVTPVERATVTFEDGVTVSALDGITVKLEDGVTVTALDGVTVATDESATVLLVSVT